MKFSIEIIIGDRYNAIDSLDKDQIHNWLLSMQKKWYIKSWDKGWILGGYTWTTFWVNKNMYWEKKLSI